VKTDRRDKGGTADGSVRPLPLGFYAKVGSQLFERDLDVPAWHEPLDDLSGSGAHVGAEQRGVFELARGVSHHDPPDGDGRLSRRVPEAGAGKGQDLADCSIVPLDP